MFQHVTNADFPTAVIAASQNKRVIVDFYSDTCGPCRMLDATLEGLHDKLDANKVALVKVKIEDSPELAMQYGIMSIPVLKAFEQGQVVAELMGNQPESALKPLLLLK